MRYYYTRYAILIGVFSMIHVREMEVRDLLDADVNRSTHVVPDY